VATAHFSLFRALDEVGHEARLFTFGDSEKQSDLKIIRNGTPIWLHKLLLKINGLVWAILQPGKKAYQIADILGSWIGARRMSRSISKFNPEVIILSDHGAPGLALKKPEGSRVILVSHHNPARFASHPTLTDFSQIDARWALQLEQKILRKVDIVVCPSNYMKDWFQKSYQFSGPVQVIPNLLDTELLDRIPAFDLQSQLAMHPDDVLIYMPSAGSRLKGAQYVLQIIREISEYSERRVGFYIPGDALPEIVEGVAKLPEGVQVCLAGQIPYEEHIANMKACTFGISPSLLENYSMALLEAVSCGVPMVAFSTGGNSDIIQDGKNGYLAPEGDINALWNLAKNLVHDLNPNKFKDQTKIYSRTKLSARNALDGYLALIEGL
jgi:glycosyltransferase involved in cell wall biosynthesis